MASKHVSYLLVVLLYGNTAAVASPQLADHGSQCAHAVDSEGKSQCDEVRLLQLRDKTTQPKVTPLLQQAYDCKCTNGYPVTGKECDKYGHERCSGCYDGYYLTGAYKCESICHVLNALITCPVLNALIKNGDLVPDYSRGCIIDKEMTRRAFLRTGISAMTANETTDANFHSAECPSCPMKINPRAMNSIDCGPPACKGESPFKQPHEHFRSTGIRDGPAVNVAVFDWIERNCLGPSGTTWFLSNNICFADSADCEREPCQPGPGTGPPGLYQRMLSNDIDVAKRPKGRYGVCTEAHSGREACPSQLHGSVSAMFREFAHPSGPHGTLSRAEQRALWLRGEYPVSFSKRSPSSCMEFTGDERGCAECLAEVDASSPDALLLAERYCRCMHAQELSETALLALETYQCICQKASKGACAVQIRPIHGTTAHYNPGPGQMPGPERFNVAEFLRGKGMQAYDCKCTHGHPVPGTECDKHGQERCANCYEGYYLNAAYKCQAPTCIYKQDSLSKCLPEGRPTADASLMACLARCSSKAACVAATFFPLGHGGWGRGARCYHLSGGCHRFPYVYSAMYWKLPGSCEAATHYRIAGGIDNETESMLGGQMIIKDDAEKDEKLRAARASAGGNDSENETTEMWGAENDTEATSATSIPASREGA